jgi:hypothetical protein
MDYLHIIEKINMHKEKRLENFKEDTIFPLGTVQGSTERLDLVSFWNNCVLIS